MQYVHELTWVVHLYICSNRSSKINNDYLESPLTALPVGMSARSLQLTVGHRGNCKPLAHERMNS